MIFLLCSLSSHHNDYATPSDCCSPLQPHDSGLDSAQEATIKSIYHALYSGLLTNRQVVSSFITRIEAYNNLTNAIVNLIPNALSIAHSLDERLAAGNATGPLFYVTVLLKDNYDIAEMPTRGTTSLALVHSQSTRDASSVLALKNAGAVIIGKATA